MKELFRYILITVLITAVVPLYATDIHLIAHRGGITENKFEEYDPASLEAAIRAGYYMVEIDVRTTKDGVLVLNHDETFYRFFNNQAKVKDLTWAEIKTLRAAKGKFHPPSLEEYAKACAGKIRLMIDAKEEVADEVYFSKLRKILKKYGLLDGAYYINNVSKNFMQGTNGKFHFRVSDIPAMDVRIKNGENVKDNYFLFDNGIRLTAASINWADANGIKVVPSVNIAHYISTPGRNGKNDIETLMNFNISEIQIDSDYEKWVNTYKALRFNGSGKFRIAQFTDLHYQYNSRRSDTAVMHILNVIKQNKPQLIVLTGDVVCSKNTALAWKSLADSLATAKVPWAVTLGNHDIEYELTGKEIMQTIQGLPYNLTINGPDSLSGSGNYMLNILASKSQKPEAAIYIFDSHTSFRGNKPYGEYQWIKLDQINWYKQASKFLTAENGNEPLPSLSFFHIPLPEYNDIIYDTLTKGIQEELVCSPEINTGLFSAIIESGDVMGVFCGHDHNNNLIGVTRNIALAYGNVSGIECYGKIGRGARIIELYEGERKFDTWITNDAQMIKYKVTYPDSFSKKK